MAEQLQTPAGQAVPIVPDPKFAAAMAAPEPGARPDYPPPPRRDPAAPHGRDATGNALAPHGTKPDGTPRMNPPGPGRGHRGDEGARVVKPGGQPAGRGAQKQLPAGAALSPQELRVRRASDAQDTLELCSAGGALYAMIMSARARATAEKAAKSGDKAMVAKAGQAVERAIVVQLDAAAAALNAEPVGGAVGDLADRNAWAAALADRLALFNGVAGVGIAIMPLIYQLAANHAPPEVRDDMPPELLQLGVLPPTMLLEKLQAKNAVKMARVQSQLLREKAEAEAELEQLRDAA